MTQAFLDIMQSDNHEASAFTDYLKDTKFLLDEHISKLSGHQVKDIAKMILSTVKDLECKLLCPTESTTESSDEDFLTELHHIKEDEIFVAFPADMLTAEV